jgi:ligand-binding sensor domain-containing protein
VHRQSTAAAVRQIVQTRDGYLSLTTFDGPARFDGVRFTVFDKRNTSAITNNRFTAVYEDRDGTLWAGADEGQVVAYRKGTFVQYSLPETARAPGVHGRQTAALSRAVRQLLDD